MDTPDSSKLGSESQDSEDLVPPGSGTTDIDLGKTTIPLPPQNASKLCGKLQPSKKGVENAKKRLRAFSIQKKTPITPLKVKPSGSGIGTNTVVIGKLTSVKVTPKPSKVEPDPDKKMLKPPKPGAGKRSLQESYTELQKSTIAEIEDMKRKMELVDLGIPLGLICPTSSTDKAMPTKAMPPIKSFLDPAKVDDLIREAKKAKAEGREFKFDYQKLLPDYDNPFQRKKDELIGSEPETPEEPEHHKITHKVERSRQNERTTSKIPSSYPSARKIIRYDNRRHTDYRRDDRDRYKDDRSRYRDKSRDIDEVKNRGESKSSDRASEKESKETDVNLNDYLVCDSWSLDNDDTKTSASPKRDEKALKSIPIPQDIPLPIDLPIKSLIEQPKEIQLMKVSEKPKDSPINKIEKLKPVIDSFKYELDSNDDEVLDIFDEETEIEKYAKAELKRDPTDSPIELKLYDYDLSSSKDISMDGTIDDTFLESVINEIKQEDMSDDDSEDNSQDKGLVEYDLSPIKGVISPNRMMDRESITPELDDRMRDLQSSRRSDCSDGYKSTESGYKSTESGYKSTDGGHKSNESNYKSSERSYKNGGGGRLDSYRHSVEKELIRSEVKLPQTTVDSLETWSFVLKICQPLLFRHDKNKCYRETRNPPKVWYTENPKLCSCVKDRSVVYEELEMCKMNLVDLVYGCDRIQDAFNPTARGWYPRQSLSLTSFSSVPASNEWEADESQTETPTLDNSRQDRHDKRRSMTPQRNEEIYLDREYQRFMEAVWPEVTDPKTETSRSTTPVRQETRKKKKTDKEEDKKKAKKIKLSSEGWSQESDIDDEAEKSKKIKLDKEKPRKRRLSTSSISDSNSEKKKKKQLKMKENKKSKSKSAKRRRLNKKYLKKLKEKEKKKKKLLKPEKMEEESEEVESEIEIKKKDRKTKKIKQQKQKKKNEKKKSIKADSTSSSDSSSSSESSSESTDSEFERKRKRDKKKSESKKKNKKKRKQSTSESTQSEELFDVNILNNIKTERLTDDEKNQKMVDFSPRRKPREIINVKELQNDFVGNNLLIKKEVEEKESESATKVDVDNTQMQSEEKTIEPPETVKKVEPEVVPEVEPEVVPEVVPEETFKEPLDVIHTTPKIIPLPEESNLSQCSSQESIGSKDRPIYEKDESHLRPSSQNSNYSFNDVITASQSALYQKGIDEEEKFVDNYEQGNYEMYEQLAMAYQSDVANQQASPPRGPASGASQRIETVVRARVLARGEIKCDWRAGAASPAPPPPAAHAPRPSRWGLKPGEVNIVLTGGNEQFPIRSVVEPVYRIQSIANRSDNSGTGYDEAYMDMYGASDRLQYGDCFAPDGPDTPAEHTGQIITPVQITSTLDARIDHALRNTVLGEVAKVTENTEAEREIPDKGILVTKSLTVVEPNRGAKRVSFADGYKPGQDSDVEEPPKKKRKSRRYGCAWPCPASHPDHVPLWDALPPPPPPPGSPPPAPPAPPDHPDHPAHPALSASLLRHASQPRARAPLLPTPPHHLIQKFDPNTSIPGFMPPEPPPGLISFP